LIFNVLETLFLILFLEKSPLANDQVYDVLPLADLLIAMEFVVLLGDVLVVMEIAVPLAHDVFLVVY
jgi:hypothetical protein